MSKGYIKLYGLVIGAIVTTGLLIAGRGLLPDIFVKVLWLVGCFVLAWLAYQAYRLWMKIRTHHLEFALKQEELRLLQADVNHRQVLTHIALTRIYPDNHGYLPVLVNDNRFLSPSQMDLLMLPQYRQGRGRETILDDVPPLESFGREPQPIKSFRELVQDGTIQQALARGEMILGYVNGEIRRGDWKTFYSCGIGGVSGSGKSTTVRFLLFQGLLGAAKLIMIDPHIHDEEESLAAQFRQFPTAHLMPPCDGRAQQVLKRIDWLQREYHRRESKGIKGPGIIFVVDEFNELMRNKEVREAMAALLLDIAQGGRKFGIFAMIMGQRWSAQDLGGADIRTSLASMLAHRFTDEDQARKMIGSKHGPKCLELPTGHYLFRDTNGALTEMITPATYAEDSDLVQSLLLNYDEFESTPESSSKVVESTLKPGQELRPLQPAFERETSPEITEISTLAAQIISMQADGLQKQDIMKRIWNVTPGGSKEYQAAQEEYKAIMRFIQTQLV